ncbi:hypothetical protein F4824DRAFT_71212 [Ustulina deusta]|nr:hypothetical protein F4824DRAFT_71212 [Ustulina deusta]
MSVPVPVPVSGAVKAISIVRRRVGSRRLRPVYFPRGIVTTASGVERSQPQSVPVSQGQPSKTPGQDPKTQRPKRTVPRLCPFNAYKATAYKLVKTYTDKINRGSPMLIRNLPGFLDGQSWIDHTTDREGSFNTPQKHLRQDPAPGFDLLKTIFESAATGRSQKDLTPGPQRAHLRAVFDELEAECKIERASFEGDYPSLLRFRDWLPLSNFRDFPLKKTIAELQETFRAKPQPWTPFTAPLVFIRAVHQYNRDQTIVANTVPSSTDSLIHDQSHPACIAGLNSLVVLEKKLTDEFPFPRIVRDIGLSTYQTKSCSIRAGVRPLRSDVRRYKDSTAVVGQLAGYSVVTLIPPRVKLLNGLSLEFDERVPKTWDRCTKRYPLGSSSFGLSSQTWTREFEAELSASGDILLATLIPGDGLLVPEGWWYGVRSINNGLQLHATVTWFLGRSDMAIGDREEYARSIYLKSFPPWVNI